MEKISIRCYREYVNVYPGVYNFPIYVPTREGWSNFVFGTCINCGELFVCDFDNPATKGQTLKSIAFKESCPSCSAELKSTLKSYPEFIYVSDGKIGTYDLNNLNSIDDKSIIWDFYEIVPGL